MRFFLTVFTLLSGLQVFAQKPDSLQVVNPDALSRPAQDSGAVPVVKRHSNGFIYRAFSKNYPNPRTSAILSMVLPGAGQAYNKKWWKVPIVWGAIGAVGYFTFDTQKTYHKLRDAYKLLVDGDPNTNPTESPYNTFDATRTKTYRDQFRGYTEKWYLALGATYLLAVTDAFVDAHLTHFDVSDDLSLRFKPSLETSSGLPVLGVGIALNFHSAAPRIPFQPQTSMFSRP